MKKITALTFGFLIAVSAFCQSDLTLNLCGDVTKASVKQFEKCRSVEVAQDGYKVFGFVVRYMINKDTLKEFKLPTNELTDEVIKDIAAYKPEKIYIENANVIDVTGEAHTAKPLILTMEY